MKYKVILNSCGNIDRRENPYKQVEDAYRQFAYCDSIEECSKAVRKYIEEYNLGSGNWNGGEVFTIDNEYLGYISYNGRFWKGENK